MNNFDLKAAEWDQNPMHRERSEIVAGKISEEIPLNNSMRALEFGAGTGLASFILKDKLKEIIMIDSSQEMVRIMNEKIKANQSTRLKAIFFDLEKEEWNRTSFDLIFSQMALHHVRDVGGIIKKFYSMLKPGGYVAVADLYAEDGSFHGNGFDGHRGFNPEILSKIFTSYNFENISYRNCYTITKTTSESLIKSFDLFLLTASRPLS